MNKVPALYDRSLDIICEFFDFGPMVHSQKGGLDFFWDYFWPSDCPCVHSQKSGLDSFSEITFDRPIVRVSVLKKRGLDSFSEITFDRPIVRVSILKRVD